MIILYSVDITERMRTVLRLLCVINTIHISALPDPNCPLHEAILYEPLIQSVRFVIANEFALVLGFNTKKLAIKSLIQLTVYGERKMNYIENTLNYSHKS
jgi:hypothetical protein